MCRHTYKLMGLLFCLLLLGRGVLAQTQETQYLQVITETAVLQSAPTANAKILYGTILLATFEWIGEHEGYSLVRSTSGEEFWIVSTSVTPYVGPTPPSAHILGRLFALPESKALGTPVVSQETQYLQVTAENTVFWAAPTVNAQILYGSGMLAIFEQTGEANGYIQVQSPSGEVLWVEAESVAPYEGPMPPPAHFKGVLLPLSKANVETYLKKRAEEGRAVVLAEKEASEQARLERLSLYTYQPSPYLYPSFSRGNYPDLDIEGFFEGKVSARDYNPKDISDPRFKTIQAQPEYNKLPLDVLVGDPRLQMRYRFNIDGKLSEDLSVHYDVEAEPDLPEKYDIRVKYKQSELTFGHSDAIFNNGEFINAKKAIDGVRFTSETDSWDTILALGRQRSDATVLPPTRGNGTKELRLQRGNILEGSVRVWVNNSSLSEGVDYTVNYFDGRITFTEIKTQTDIIKVVYEATNPIEDFLPALSRTNFTGAQYRWRAASQDDKVLTVGHYSQRIVHNDPTTVTENTGLIFQLGNKPVVLDTDVVLLNNRRLRRNHDYVIRHSRGRLKIINRVLKEGDELKVTYGAYKTQSNRQTIVADGTVGPYFFKQSPVLRNSLVVELDGRLLSESIDYRVDYELGKLYFNYPVSYPRLVRVSYDAIQSTVRPKQEGQSPFSVGVTYMNERVKSQDEELELKATNEAHTVTENTGVFSFNTNNFPLFPSQNITMTVNGVSTTTDFKIVNSYTGEIELTAVTSGPVDVVVTEYSYRKGFSTSYSFNGETSEKLLYVNQDTRMPQFLLIDTPVKFQSLDSIKITGLDDKNNPVEIKLQEGTGFTVKYFDPDDLFDAGRKIEITLKQRGLGDNQSDLYFSPNGNNTITLFYEYTPEVGLDQGDFDKTMVGVSVGAKLGKHWKFGAELVGAESNFSQPRADGSFTGPGNGITNNVYQLGKRGLVDNSEVVKITNKFGPEQLTRDSDYFINYDLGTLRFLKRTVLPEETIDVTFQFYDRSGTTTVGTGAGMQLATKVSSEYETASLKLKGEFKTIDKEFSPLSPIQEAKGSTVLDLSGDWAINQFDNVGATYRGVQQFIPGRLHSVTGEEIFLRTRDFNANGNTSFWDDTLNATLRVRLLNTVEDPSLPSGNTHFVDDSTTEVEGGLEYKIPNFTAKLHKTIDQTQKDYLDKVNPSDVNIDTTVLDGTWVLPSLLYAGYVSFTPAFSNVEETRQFSENPSQNSVLIRRHYGTSSIWKPFRQLTGRFSYFLDDVISETGTGSGFEKIETNSLNNAFSFDYTPYGWVDLRYSHSREEARNAAPNQKSDLVLRNGYDVTRYSPFGMMTKMGIDPENIWIRSIRGTTIKLGFGDSDSRKRNGGVLVDSNSRSMSFTHFEPFPGLQLTTGAYTRRIDNSTDTTITGVSSNVYMRSYREKSLGAVFRPKIGFFDAWSYTLDFEDTIDTRRTNREATSATSSVEVIRLPEFLRRQNLSFNPGSLELPWGGGVVNMGRFSAYVKEDWTDKVNSTITDLTPSFSVTPRKTTIIQDNVLRQIYTYHADYSPFDMFSTNTTYITTDEKFDRKVAAVTGTTIKAATALSIGLTMTPLPKLTLTGAFAQDELVQLRSPTLNMTRQTIEDAIVAGDATRFTDAIKPKVVTTWSLGTGYDLFKTLTLRGKVAIKDITQVIITTGNTVETLIEQKIGTLGLVYKPFKGVVLSSDYSIKDTNGQSGTSIKTGLTYTVVKSRDFEANIRYSRTDNLGKGLNELDNVVSVSGSGDEQEIVVKDVDDTTQTLSVEAHLVFPLPNSPYVDNFTITAEGYFKIIEDRKDAQKAADEPKNSYDVGGVVLKGTLNF